MKTIGHILTFIGIALLFYAILMMFSVTSGTDKHLLLSLFGGVSVTMTGLGIGTYIEKPLSHYQKSVRASQLRSCMYCVGLCIVMLFVIYSFV